MPLFDTHPELEQLWDHEKNTEQNPADFGPNSRTRVFWRCTQGHSWEFVGIQRSNHAYKMSLLLG